MIVKIINPIYWKLPEMQGELEKIQNKDFWTHLSIFGDLKFEFAVRWKDRIDWPRYCHYQKAGIVAPVIKAMCAEDSSFLNDLKMKYFNLYGRELRYSLYI